MLCSNCSFENAGSAKFCMECGTPLRARTESAERRQLTVFFVDLVGSTELSQRLDPEGLRELIIDYQTRCGAVIGRYDGHVAQHLGDGILAYFGYPHAHEDDAVRAVRSALEIMQEMARPALHGEQLHVRVAIHTGRVVVGDVGGRGWAQLALGEAPNVAARMQQAAEADSIVISEATYRLVAGLFELEDLGKRRLKDVADPVNMYRVRSARATSRFAALTAAAGLTRFVGREREVEWIREAWRLASRGTGQTLVLRGEAGIGKSRLLGIARAVAEVPHETFEAECSPYQMNSALHPIAEMLERRLDFTPDTPGAERLDLLEQFAAGRGVPLGEALPLLADVLGIEGVPDPNADLSPPKRRQRTLEVLTETLIHAPGRAPVVVLIEDLHWADPSTLDLIRALAGRQAAEPVLIVCTTRPNGRSALPLEAPHCREIQVRPLPHQEARQLIASVVGGKPLPEEVTQEIIDRTAGIPLFTEAVTRTILEAGVLRETDDRYLLTGPLPPGLIPATVQDSLTARIDRLGEDKPVAQLAATIGRDFTVDLLAAVAGRSDDALRLALGSMVSLGLVFEAGGEPGTTYSFKHALIQDAAYESLLKKTRQEFHGQIARALLARTPALAEEKPHVLARHYEGAGRTSEAIELWMRAGQLAQQRSANAECVGHLRRALSLLSAMPEQDPERTTREMAVQLALGPALMATQGWGSREVEVACGRARELCERTGNHQGLLAALWGLWTVRFVRGEMSPALEAATPVLQMALATDNPVLRLAGRHAIGFTEYFRGDFEAARGHGEAGLEHFSLDLERALVSVFQLPSSVACGVFLSQSLWFMGFPEQAEARHRDAWRLVGTLDNVTCTAYGIGVCIFLHYARRDRDTIAEWAERLHELCTQEGFLLWAAQARIYRGWVQAMRGEPLGLAEMEAGIAGYRATGSGLMMPQMWLMQAEALRASGRIGDALAALSTALKTVEELGERVYEPELHRLRGEIQLEQGAAQRGEATLWRAIEVARKQKARMLELRAATALAAHWRRSGRTEEARSLLRPIYAAFTEGHDTPDLRAAAALLEGESVLGGPEPRGRASAADGTQPSPNIGG